LRRFDDGNDGGNFVMEYALLVGDDDDDNADTRMKRERTAPEDVPDNLLHYTRPLSLDLHHKLISNFPAADDPFNSSDIEFEAIRGKRQAFIGGADSIRSFGIEANVQAA